MSERNGSRPGRERFRRRKTDVGSNKTVGIPWPQTIVRPAADERERAPLRYSVEGSTTGFDTVPLSNLGYALSDFGGGEITPFAVELLGRRPNGGVAGVDLILARASGPIIERIGGVPPEAGGSPVYIGGRLVGAIGYVFAPDYRLVGITPIDAIWSLSEEPGSPTDRSPGAGSPEGSTSPGSPTALPLVLSGYTSDRACSRLVARFGGRAGQLPRLALGREAAATEPGGTVGVGLLMGDLRAGILGTTTQVEEESLYAFGHPVFFVGATDLPLTEGSIYATGRGSPPGKVGDVAGILGTIVQDRAAGILARIGQDPAVVQIDVMVTDLDRGVTEAVRARAANYPPLLPDLIGSAAYEGMLRAMNRIGKGTARWEWDMTSGSPNEPFRRRREFVEFDTVDIADAVSVSVYRVYDEVAGSGRPLERVQLTAVVEAADTKGE